jgi:hypothetical protein
MAFVTPCPVFTVGKLHLVVVAVQGPPPSLHFPFSYIKLSFINLIKFLFEQFPPTWLIYFKGALVLLTAYDFLDSHIATLVSHLYFTQDGIFVID